MKKKNILMALLLIFGITLTACDAAPPLGKDKAETYKRITADEAKDKMDKDAIILDVRTPEEFEAAHIPNALLIPNTEIANKAEAMLKDKAQTILVYCRSGNRSESAAKELIAMGYQNVYDFGGINGWKGERVKGKMEKMDGQ